MSKPQRTASMSVENDIRKRVCKACDRCRLKKSKCDGTSPCSRCRGHNAICVFGVRKNPHDKVYPKGYAEMLEQQQALLVAGLRELYRRLNAGEGWPGVALNEATNGHPHTHDILERLDLLHMQTEDHVMTDGFEKDPEAMQQKFIYSDASLIRRRGSISSSSDHNHEDHDSPLSYTPTSAHSLQFSEAIPSYRAPPMAPTSTQLSTAKPISTTFPQLMQGGIEASTFARFVLTAQNPAIVSDNSMDFIPYESPIGYDMMVYPTLGHQAPQMMSQVPMPDFNDLMDTDFTNFIAATS